MEYQVEKWCQWIVPSQLLSFLSTDDISSSLGRPYKLQWKIQDDTVILSWEYPSGNQYPTGYYIHVQEAPMKGDLGTPDFVHVKNGLLSTVLRGFKPKTRYLVKVMHNS